MRLFLAAALIAACAGPAAAADGAKVFALQCKSCHGPASTPMGPSLAGVAGADIAGRGDFKYSAGLSAKPGTWTDAALDAYLTNPVGFAPGSRMTVRVANPEQRAAVVAYMKTLK